MHVKALKLVNFKRFRDDYLEFNDDVNILVGDNNAGKSSILEALEIVLNYNYRGRQFSGEFSPDLFNKSAVAQFLASDKKAEKLPTLIIEVYLEGIPDYKGTNNNLGADAQGVMVKAAFDTSLADAYEKHIVGNPKISSIPIEFYKVEWLDFSWKEIKAISKSFRALYIDPSRIHPTSGKNQYIAGILNTALEGDELRNLILNYRENLQAFNGSEEVRAVNATLDDQHLITDTN